MEQVLRVALKISKFLYALSGIALVWMMLLTVADVILRQFGRPILGAYELVSFSGAVVIGFGLPYTSWTKGHVYMEFLIEKIPENLRKVANFLTRLLGIALFAVASYNLFIVGSDLRKTGEVSLTLNFPFYPIAYGLGICCLIITLMLLCDIIKIYGERDG
ncbi:MAG: TRAP transporter small permease [Thermodesulfobacteriota bacterium]